jgi:ribonuclease HI
VIDDITRYIKNWQKNGWRTTAKKAVLNQDLWQALDKLTSARQVEWHWVKGHSDDPHNDRVDYLAKLSYK